MAKASQTADITLHYNLFDLPTAQHKAGLAGLLLLIDSMRQRGFTQLPVVVNFTPTSVTLVITQHSLQAVFDDLYDAELREIEPKAKKKGKAAKQKPPVVGVRAEDEDIKKGKSFVLPKARFLEHHYPGDENGWLKLWREMVWGVLRTRYKNRLVYEERALGKPSTEGKHSWKDLLSFSQKRDMDQTYLSGISSSVFVGAQTENSEKIPFNGRCDQNLLLHFWPLAVQVFVSQVIKRDEKGEFKEKYKGFVLAIPEVSDLEEFCDTFPRSLAALDPELHRYRPKASMVDIPAEGGLEFLRHLTLVAQQKVGRGGLKYSVSAIELFHLEKQTNNIKMWAADRIAPRPGLMGQYEGIRTFCRNPYFKSQLLINLIREIDWHEGFSRLFTEHPWEFFVRSDATPSTFPFFSVDVRKKFEVINDEFQHQQEAYAMAESVTPKPQSVEKRIYDMIGAYVRYKARDKSGVKDDFKNEAYLKAKEKICSDVFLAMRSRRDQAFIEYFTGTICSVPQFLPGDDYMFVSQALLEDGGWEKVKALSMLALSAHS